MKVKFTQFFDVSTSASQFQVLTVTAGGNIVKQRCAPQFACYKYYKLGKVSVKVVPASTLPVDPTGLSYEAGESTVDPRDMFNPGLVRITNGEDIGDFTNWDMDTYYATLLDPRWYKFRLQQGFKRTAVPLAYNVGQIHQSTSPGHILTSPLMDGTYQRLAQVEAGGVTAITHSSTTDYDLLKQYALLQTGRVKLGWMPTDGLTDMYKSGTSAVSTIQGGILTRVPEIDLITFIFPKAYKTLFYYRVFVTTEVLFKDPVVINPILNSNNYPFTPVDRYVGMGLMTRSEGSTTIPIQWKASGAGGSDT